MPKLAIALSPRYGRRMGVRLEKRLDWGRAALGSLDLTFTSNPFRALRNRSFIAASARVGSRRLREGLRQHGAVFAEFFDPPKVEAKCAELGLTRSENYCLDTLVDVSVDLDEHRFVRSDPLLGFIYGAAVAGWRTPSILAFRSPTRIAT
jgi:hypothetical protein